MNPGLGTVTLTLLTTGAAPSLSKRPVQNATRSSSVRTVAVAVFPVRDLTGEVGKHFHGTAEERVLQAIRLGQLCLNLFLANQASG